jgi:hypothetical protein
MEALNPALSSRKRESNSGACLLEKKKKICCHASLTPFRQTAFDLLAHDSAYVWRSFALEQDQLNICSDGLLDTYGMFQCWTSLSTNIKLNQFLVRLYRSCRLICQDPVPDVESSGASAASYWKAAAKPSVNGSDLVAFAWWLGLWRFLRTETFGIWRFFPSFPLAPLRL